MSKRWRQVLAFPLAALLLGLATKAVFPEGFGVVVESESEEEFTRVTWEETAPRVEAGDWVLVDARDEEQFHARHIPGAISLPSNAYPEMIEFFAEEQGRNKTVVVYCGTEDCDLSTELALRLRDEAGFQDIRILDGGFLAWQRSR
jgi:rhodanese-related sulfurtransferase